MDKQFVNSFNSDKLLMVGKLLSPHGVRGQLRLEVLSDVPGRFETGRSFISERMGSLRLISVAEHGGVLLVAFDGINDRTVAEKLVNSYLYIDEMEAEPLPEGHYYYFQLAGLEVFDFNDGTRIGMLREVLPYAANDVYVISRSSGGELHLPGLKSVIKKIDLTCARIEVIIPPGLE